MNFQEIINYLITEKQISKEELGYLTGVPLLRVELWAGGASEPKGSKAAKLKALYCNEAIADEASFEDMGNVIKKENYNALKAFTQKKEKLAIITLLISKVALFIGGAFILLVAAILLGSRLATKPITEISAYFIGIFLPALLTLCGGQKISAIAKKCSLADNGAFNFYLFIFIAGIMMHLISGYIMGQITLVAFIIGILSFLFPLLLSHFDFILKNIPRNYSYRDIAYLTGCIGIFSFLYINNASLSAELNTLITDTSSIILGYLPMSFALMNPYIVICFILLCCSISAHKTPLSIEKYYRPAEGKRIISKKSNIIAVAVTLVLSLSFCIGFWSYSISILKSTVSDSLEKYPFEKIVDYKGYEVSFGKEKTISVSNETFSLKLPAELKARDSGVYIDAESTFAAALKTNAHTNSLSDTYDVFNYNSYEEENHKLITKYRDIVKKHNGGKYPETELEWIRLYSSLENFNLNKRYEAATALPLAYMRAMLQSGSETKSISREYYLTDDIEGLMICQELSSSIYYTFNFSKPGSEFLDNTVQIIIKSEDGKRTEDTDNAARKIINSISF